MISKTKIILLLLLCLPFGVWAQNAEVESAPDEIHGDKEIDSNSISGDDDYTYWQSLKFSTLYNIVNCGTYNPVAFNKDVWRTGGSSFGLSLTIPLRKPASDEFPDFANLYPSLKLGFARTYFQGFYNSDNFSDAVNLDISLYDFKLQLTGGFCFLGFYKSFISEAEVNGLNALETNDFLVIPKKDYGLVFGIDTFNFVLELKIGLRKNEFQSMGANGEKGNFKTRAISLKFEI